MMQDTPLELAMFKVGDYVEKYKGEALERNRANRAGKFPLGKMAARLKSDE